MKFKQQSKQLGESEKIWESNLNKTYFDEKQVKSGVFQFYLAEERINELKVVC